LDQALDQPPPVSRKEGAEQEMAGVYIYRSKTNCIDPMQGNDLEVLDNPVLSQYLKGEWSCVFLQLASF
jgi:hypothetical protein